MDTEVYKKTHKRIRELTPAGDPEYPDPLAVMMTNRERKHWYAAIDSGIPDEEEAVLGDDTWSIPCDRLLMVGSGRMVPASNLPSYISYVKTADIYSSVEQLPSTGDIQYVYVVREEGSSSNRYYRWVKNDGTDGYVSIPYNLILSDGDGILAVDLNGEYERKFDIDLGTPSAHDDNILALTGNKLVHTMSGVVNGVSDTKTMPDAQQVTVPGFGDSFYVPRYTVDSTGHVRVIDKDTVTVPKTPATSASPGLLKIGSLSDIKPIASSCALGSAASGGYTLVAPADHKHSASTLTFTNLPTASTITYNMVSDVTIDMKDTIRALPPGNQPQSDEMILNTTAPSGNDMTTAWTSVDDFFNKVSYTINAGNSYIINDGTELRHLDIKADCLLLVSADVKVSLTEGLGSALVNNVPYDYTCDLYIGDVKHTYNLRGDFTYSLPIKIQYNALIKTSASQEQLHLRASIVDNGGQTVGIFRGQCTRFDAVELM